MRISGLEDEGAVKHALPLESTQQALLPKKWPTLQQCMRPYSRSVSLCSSFLTSSGDADGKRSAVCDLRQPRTADHPDLPRAAPRE
ncbi:hypothetical protein FQA47_015329 [Oryzias melastigma]|uniref:Uncharacterized protein n=1 Tax=Oryzias melastigma TaxID=30732 RepID=A0A834FHK7_ORYME|nr:hypothetical protein FQA47_015329 [Oryzias melastigma]